MLQSIREGSRLTVRLAGELDHCCAVSVRRELDRLIADPTIRTLILDFSVLQFMDSSGIGLIMGRYRLMRELGGELRVTGVPSHIKKVMRLSGLDKLAVLEPDSIPKETRK